MFNFVYGYVQVLLTFCSIYVKQTEMTQSKCKAQTETNFVMYETTNTHFKRVRTNWVAIVINSERNNPH